MLTPTYHSERREDFCAIARSLRDESAFSGLAATRSESKD
jgi:hypothetical protein